MYTEIQLSYGPVLYADLKNFYLLRKQDITEGSNEIVYTYFVVGVYNSREYDVEKDVYEDLKEECKKMAQAEETRDAKFSNLLVQLTHKKVGRPSKDAEI